ncbi:MAG: hypothetical protein ACXADC_05870 [Candidatus Thorarchaeota archaeon]
MSRRTIQNSKLISKLLIVLLLVSINSTVLNNYQMKSLNRSEMHSLSSEGPSIILYTGNLSVDLFPSPVPVELLFELLVDVVDPDGVDTVIGSWASADDWDDVDLSWENVTMAHSPEEDLPDKYEAKVLNFTLGPEDWFTIMYFKFYANDSLGNWSATGVWYTSYFGGSLGPPYFEMIAIIVLLILPMSIIALLIVSKRSPRIKELLDR